MGLLQLEHLQKKYGDFIAVSDVTLTIQPGEWVTFLGPSGSGKTTTLRMVAGFIEPTAGRIRLDGEVLTSVADRIHQPPEQRQMGMVFQSYAVWPHMTVFKNVAYPLKFQRLEAATRHTRVDKMLRMVQLDHLAHRYPSELSGGQQQRVALARALVMQPKLLLLDEPLSNLDAKLRDDLRAEIVELTRRVGATVLYVTHDQTEALAMSDRVVVMNQGNIQQIATPQVIYQTPANHFVATFVGVANLFPCQIVTREGSSLMVDLALGGVTKRIRVEHPITAVDAMSPPTLMVRPENIVIKAPEAAEIWGQVTQRVYLGDRINLQITLGQGEGQLSGATIQANTVMTPYQPGDWVGLDIHHPVLIPGDAQVMATPQPVLAV